MRTQLPQNIQPSPVEKAPPLATYKDIDEFTNAYPLSKTSLHTIFTMLKNKKLWYVKKDYYSERLAQIEVLSQEFLRLIRISNPTISIGQPKTRLVLGAQDGDWPLQVASKEIIGYQPLVKIPTDTLFTKLKLGKHQYELCLMSSNIQPEKNKLYIAKVGNLLKYSVIGLSGKLETGTIALKKLKHVIKEPLNLDELKPLLSDMLSIIAAEGHIQLGYYGLGEVLALSLFLSQNDLHMGNLGVDKEGNIIGLDGDWCMAGFIKHDTWGYAQNVDHANYYVTYRDYESLPFLASYPTSRWLDLVKKGMRRITPLTHRYAEIAVLPSFQREIHATNLKIMLLPSTLLVEFVKRYVREPKWIKNFSDYLQDRQETLMRELVKSESFRNYLFSQEASDDLATYIPYLKDFRTMRHDFLLDDVLNVEKEMQEKLISLQKNAAAQAKKSLEKPVSVYPVKETLDKLASLCKKNNVNTKKDLPKSIPVYSLDPTLSSSYATGTSLPIEIKNVIQKWWDNIVSVFKFLWRKVFHSTQPAVKTSPIVSPVTTSRILANLSPENKLHSKMTRLLKEAVGRVELLNIVTKNAKESQDFKKQERETTDVTWRRQLVYQLKKLQENTSDYISKHNDVVQVKWQVEIQLARFKSELATIEPLARQSQICKDRKKVLLVNIQTLSTVNAQLDKCLDANQSEKMCRKMINRVCKQEKNINIIESRKLFYQQKMQAMQNILGVLPQELKSVPTGKNVPLWQAPKRT